MFNIINNTIEVLIIVKAYEIRLENDNMELFFCEFSEAFNPNFMHESKNGSIRTYIFEWYYVRISSYLSTTVIFEMVDSNKYIINIIVSGGAQGHLGLTWGSERNMMKKLIEFFSEYGGVASQLKKKIKSENIDFSKMSPKERERTIKKFKKKSYFTG
ncbi:MAG: DUF6054 family protein [Promethearchaeota archaeon]